MTGSAWGREPGSDESGSIAVEIRSVNGRGLTIKTRLSAELAGCERAIEELVRKRVHRGTVFVHVALERASSDVAQAVDEERFAAAAERLRRLAERAGLAPPTVGDVLQVPNVVAAGGGPEVGAGPVEPPPGLLAAVDAVLEGLCASREQEAVATVAAVCEHLDELERGVDAIAARAPVILDVHRQNLIDRVNEFLDGRGIQLDPDDVVRELGVFADRTDVSEELQRLRAHVGRAREMIDAGGQVGRPLEFLFQELLRETNTIGSKSPDVEVAHTVVAMKSAVDRLKEQAANLE